MDADRHLLTQRARHSSNTFSSKSILPKFCFKLNFFEAKYFCIANLFHDFIVLLIDLREFKNR